MKLKSIVFLLLVALFLSGQSCETTQGTGGMGANTLSDSGDPYDDGTQTAGSDQGITNPPAEGGTAASNQASAAPVHRNINRAKFKKTIAVARFEQRANIASKYALGTGMADQLTDALVNSHNFVVLERQTLSDVIAEQNLAAGARMAKSKTAQIGKFCD